MFWIAAQKLLSEVSARFHSDRTSAERVLWVYEAQAFLNSSKSEGDCVQAIALAQKVPCSHINVTIYHLPSTPFFVCISGLWTCQCRGSCINNQG